ncbi:MAG: radical SAM protein [Candidatus Liptonbacteria bacterium CG11_big_fil_rev_8_21_14_0_20_35_14]|uniref:Radical SAM protein n=1 Tax=Candidatus Liptonbacteria bacterium CG11_big_fil_rev_8_21_14_0_20_35_14 TaxID=1974634 RepID=A0A2H0N7T1_9BACT|nr:MAG: radical SAM protein [Candidatus Liptonbacteria bacterium CG11_big_fil_rev_8_21_14_0_20_35_14]
MDINFVLDTIVLQPTSFCNIDCLYCYLPDRHKNMRMNPVVTQKISESISDYNKDITLLWHGGEPLACGIKHFSLLIEPFKKLKNTGILDHTIQTNGTLINENWCEFFISHNFNVGISIDGPIWANKNRIDKKGQETYARIIKGIQYLKDNNINFTVIAVVSKESLTRAKEIYEFFCMLKCSSVGFNIEEKENVNKREICDNNMVTNFWSDLFDFWKANPVIEVREFSQILSRIELLSTEEDKEPVNLQYSIYPSITYNGDIVLLSPEFLGAKAPQYDDFIVGNINNESLLSIINRMNNISYVDDYVNGIKKCAMDCEYFSFCGGGWASNKFFELGSINTTETVFCRNYKQRPLEAVVNQL